MSDYIKENMDRSEEEVFKWGKYVLYRTVGESLQLMHDDLEGFLCFKEELTLLEYRKKINLIIYISTQIKNLIDSSFFGYSPSK